MPSGGAAGEVMADGDAADEDLASGTGAKFAAFGAAPRDVGDMEAAGLTLGAPGFSMAAAVTVLASAPMTEKSMNFGKSANFCIAKFLDPSRSPPSVGSAHIVVI
jgi:hypothetical protein